MGGGECVTWTQTVFKGVLPLGSRLTMKLKIACLIALGLVLSEVPKASAALTNSYQFNGKGNWSIDGVGSNNTPVGSIDAIVPLGSTVVKAFLYSTTYNFDAPFTPIVNFDGTTYSTWTDLGFAVTCCGLKAFRTDVTTQVATKIGGGAASPFVFDVLSENPNGSIDGTVLALVYSNPAEQERTISFLDGNTAATGTTTFVNLTTPLTSTQLLDPTFEALMSLGIGFSFQTGSNQYSTIDVNSTRLTSAAGGSDDGTPGNGGLITVGGIGDSTANPANPLAIPSSDYSAAPRLDDELYSLKPFLNVGDTQIRIESTNPSNDDNIFFVGVNLTAKANVCVDDPDLCRTVPEPTSTLSLLALGTLGAASTLKRQLKPSKSSEKETTKVG
ncbi:PEP-CTERM sorting domain-containing protein [Microcystis aeruginosa FBCC-A68]|uniref:PEP-CTERM sorting domain-containing protein n=2 Tax=Microcystis aeruginosa TaxID=1126 RepID=UPI003D283DDB